VEASASRLKRERQRGRTQLDRRLSLENAALIALVTAMVAVGALGWWLRMGPDILVDVSPLENVPTRIGVWESSDLPLSRAVEDELRADFNLQRTYVSRLGDLVWVYVGYYGTERGGRPEHTPRGCYTGAGWGIESSRTVDITPSAALRANEYLLTNSGQSRLVHFWYRSHRRTGILGGLDQNLDRLMGRLLDRRADGALVRVSTPIMNSDTVAARGRLISFASMLDPLLGEHWPSEIPCDEVGPTGCTKMRDDQAQVQRHSQAGESPVSQLE
jgi:EpsI family protein